MKNIQAESFTVYMILHRLVLSAILNLLKILKKQSDVNKETSLSNKALAEANKIAIDKIIAMMNAKQAQDVITFLSKVDAVAQYQPKGDYVTENRIVKKSF